MSALAADGAVFCAPLPPLSMHTAGKCQRWLRGIERLPVTPQVDALARDCGHRDVLRRLHGAGDRLRDAAARVGVEAHAGRGRHDHLGRLCRPVVRGACLFGSLAEKIGRLKTLFVTIVLFVSMDIACLFAWSGAVDDGFPLLAGSGYGGRGAGGERLHQRVYRRGEARALLPALRGIFPIGLDVRWDGRASSWYRSTAGRQCSSSA